MADGFLVSLVGSAVGAGLVAWIVGHFTERGRQAAIKASFEDVLRQARQRAADEERGKRLATHEDIENVLGELRLVTRETEQIKASVSQKAQTYLRAWEERRNLYVKLIEWTSKHMSLVAAARLALASDDGLDDRFKLISNSHLEVIQLASLIVMFGSAELREAWAHFSQGDLPPGECSRTRGWCTSEIDRVNRLASAISVVAAKDLWGQDRDAGLQRDAS
jgi:hypothetical protein